MSTSASLPSRGGWADTLYSRLIAAHCGGDDAIALDAARRLDRFRKAVEAKAGALDRRRPADSVRPEAGLRAKCERHHRAPGRPGAPGQGSPARAGPAARGRPRREDRGPDPRLRPDPCRATESTSAGPSPATARSSVRWSPRATRPSAAAGRAGVGHEADPLHLLAGTGIDRTRPVGWAVYAALQRLLKTERFMDDMSDYTEMKTAEGRKRLAGAARAFWEKNRAVPHGRALVSDPARRLGRAGPLDRGGDRASSSRPAAQRRPWGTSP